MDRKFWKKSGTRREDLLEEWRNIGEEKTP